jgi:hypothetical protein
MDESRKVATTGVFYCGDKLGIQLKELDEPIHLHFMGGSTKKDGPSAGGAIGLALASLLTGRKIRRDVAMTGEIDTKGRISAVGALALKIETACNAGCKTMIIPRDNLYGDDGIERLPRALKEELQILTYEEWATTHEPFDYVRHILQVVAVDSIIQATTVAFIDDAEMESLEVSFDLFGHAVSERLKDRRMESGRFVQIILAKSPEELDAQFFEPAAWKERTEVVLLIVPESRESMLAHLADKRPQVKVRDFDPKRENLVQVTRAILDSYEAEASEMLSIGLIAPYYFFKRDGISPREFPPTPSFAGVRLFANNYTLQDIKIKRCKPALDLVGCLLNRLPQTDLDACPFLAIRDDIYLADLSFIPEKYRLDTRRAECILNRALAHWLNTVNRLFVSEI